MFEHYRDRLVINSKKTTVESRQYSKTGHAWRGREVSKAKLLGMHVL